MFLARVTSWCAAPALLSACGRDETPVAMKPASVDHLRRAVPPVEVVDTRVERPHLPSVEPEVRVRVVAVRDAGRLRIGSEGRWIEFRTIAAGEDATSKGGAVESAAVVLHAPVDVRMREGRWSVLDDHGFRPRVEGNEAIELRAPAEDAGPDGPTVTVDDQPYPGAVRLVPQPHRGTYAYDVVNHVPVERYLPGVLAKELYSYWHPSTYAAQAIAARSFAFAERSYRSHVHYDLTSTDASQMYIGRAAHGIAIAAAQHTRGLLLVHQGRVVPGYYSSCCGGRAACAVDAIARNAFNAIPPLGGRPGPDVCTDADLYAWSMERRASDVAHRMRAWGKRNDVAVLAGMKRISAIEIATLNPHGRPRTYNIRTGAGETVELAAESMRRAADYGGGGIGRIRKRLFSSNVTVAIADGTARFEGAGFGHGVGLCQHGAESLARAGMDSRAIVGWYYPGVNIEQAYV